MVARFGHHSFHHCKMMWGLGSYVGRALCGVENVSIQGNVNNKVNVFFREIFRCLGIIVVHRHSHLLEKLF